MSGPDPGRAEEYCDESVGLARSDRRLGITRRRRRGGRGEDWPARNVADKSVPSPPGHPARRALGLTATALAVSAYLLPVNSAFVSE